MMMREEERNETRRVGIGPGLRVVIKERVHSGVMTREKWYQVEKRRTMGEQWGKLHREK